MTISKEQAMLYQRALREIVAPSLKVDGALGQASTIALQELAKTHGITPPSDFSGPVMKILDGYVESRYVTDKAFSDAAALLSVKESHIRAVAEVESQGSGFLPDGRVKILFERHWFYKKILGAMQTKKDVAKQVALVLGFNSEDPVELRRALNAREVNICDATRGGYVGNAGEYARMDKAATYDLESALQSTSYGAYQIMGFNCQAAGYNTAREMFLAFAESEAKQFMGFVSFIKADPNLLKQLSAGNWSSFALGYNGPSYAENKYHIKMADAEKKYQGYNKKA